MITASGPNRSRRRPGFLQVLALAAGLAFASSVVLAADDYVQAPGSTLTFASSFEGEVFTGYFASFTTTMRFDPQQLEQARLDVTIPLASATTANPERDETLQGSDFFSSKRFPQARFVATRFRHLGEDRYAADGALSLRDASHPVTLTFTWKDGAAPVLTGRASVDRLAFGVGGGDWADPGMIPANVAVSTRVNLMPAP